MPPTPGSPAHNEVIALKEGVAKLQAEVADLKSKIALQDTDRDGLQGRLKLQDEQYNKLMAESKQQAKDHQKTLTELTDVKARSDTLNVSRKKLASKNISLEAKVSELQAEADVLRAFKQTHILEAQPRLVDLMTMENMVDDEDGGEDKARRAAELTYVEIFGIPIAGSDDGEPAMTLD
jgi:chromosome segregation ATPase